MGFDTFSVRWVGGWMGGEMKIKANHSQSWSCGWGWEEKWRLKLTSDKVVVEVEAELGKNYFMKQIYLQRNIKREMHQCATYQNNPYNKVSLIAF